MGGGGSFDLVAVVLVLAAISILGFTGSKIVTLGRYQGRAGGCGWGIVVGIILAIVAGFFYFFS